MASLTANSAAAAQVPATVTQTAPTVTATPPATTAKNRFDHANWVPGKATVFGSIPGLRRWPVSFTAGSPSFAAQESKVAPPPSAGGLGLGQGVGAATGSAGLLPGVNPSGGAPSVKGGTYDKAALEQLWIAAGGNPAKANIAAAIALAESSGIVNSTNHDSNGTTDIGLWQINTVHGSLAVFDPLANARSAVAISNNGTDWSAWVTFNNGAYKQHL